MRAMPNPTPSARRAAPRAPVSACAAALATALSLQAGAARAERIDPAEDVILPRVEAGETEVDLKAGAARLRDGRLARKESVAFGWGVNERWFTEIYAIWAKPPGERHAFDAWEWENRLLLTDPDDDAPLAVALQLELDRNHERSEGWETRWGVLAEYHFSAAWQGNLNLLLAKPVRSEASPRAELDYQAQVRHRSGGPLDVGLQAFGTLGPWRDWRGRSEQRHLLGPAIYGKIESLGVSVNAGLLAGLTNGSPRTTLRLQLEVEL